MIVGSLFSGIGGFDYGLERAGMRVAWQCEADQFCRRVLARHWPEVPCYPDVRELRGADIEPVDVLCGGFPCQDISLAGKGAGIGGTRSGLWAEYARLIRELRPSYVVVENVSALLARGLDRVLADLASCGYDAEWDCLPASAFGAPHRRDRLWLIAYPGGEQHQGESPAIGRSAASGLPEDAPNADGRGRLEGIAGVQARQPDAEGSGRELADTDCLGRRPDARQGCDAARLTPSGDESAVALADSECEGELQPEGLERQERRRPSDSGSGDVQDADELAVRAWRVRGRIAQAGGSEWWAAEPPVGRVAHGVPDRLDQLASLGNALVPQIAEWLGRRILEAESVG